MVYSTARDGYNLSTFVAKNSHFEETLIFIRTSEGKRFGAFVSKGLVVVVVVGREKRRISGRDLS